MVLEVKKEERETGQALIRRFTTKVKRSGILVRARKGRFFQKLKSKQLKKRSAIRREDMKKHYEKLKKLGKATSKTRTRR